MTSRTRHRMRAAIYRQINIFVQMEEGQEMLAHIRMVLPSRKNQSIGPSRTFVIGRREEPVDDKTGLWICKGRRALSRRSVVLENTGTILRIENKQDSGTGEVWLENRSGHVWRLGYEPYQLQPHSQVILRIIPSDGLGKIEMVLITEGRAQPDPGKTNLHEELADDDERILLVNSIALAQARLPEGALVTPKSVKAYFLPAVGKALGYDRKFDECASQLCVRYGLDDRRGLLDLLRVGRTKGDIRDSVIQRLNKAGTDD